MGGLFIPLVVAGALAGATIGGAVNRGDLELFIVVGVAAFLGAGYRVPLAAVMFVAETTGRASFIVPALLAAVAAELVMGRSSVTTLPAPGRTRSRRRPRRIDLTDRRLTKPHPEGVAPACAGERAPQWRVGERGKTRDGFDRGAEAEDVAGSLRAGDDVAHVAEPVPARDDRRQRRPEPRRRWRSPSPGP